MTRAQRALDLLRQIKNSDGAERWKDAIDAILAMPEGDGEKVDREVAEMLEEALRMNF